MVKGKEPSGYGVTVGVFVYEFSSVPFIIYLNIKTIKNRVGKLTSEMYKKIGGVYIITSSCTYIKYLFK